MKTTEVFGRRWPGTTTDLEWVAEYDARGYHVLENALSTTELDELRAEAAQICRGNRGEIKGVTPADPDATDLDVLMQYLCIHFPHKVSEIMFRYLSQPTIVDALTQIIGPNVKTMQSMLFIKAAGKPGQAWHQDEFFIPTRDRSLTAAWIAMDEATTENGCLWVIPGSHRPGLLWQMREVDDPGYDCTHESYGFPYGDDEAIAVEVKAGTVVLFDGYLLHKSEQNVAKTGCRRSLVNHYMSAESLLHWDEVVHGDNRDIVMVAGKDPYGYKGTYSIAGSHVRPFGRGGCRAYRSEGEMEEEESKWQSR